MSAMAFQITGVSIVCSTVGLGADQRKHHSSASLSFVQGIHRWPVNSPHKRPVTRKMFPFDDAIMEFHSSRATCLINLYCICWYCWNCFNIIYVVFGKRMVFCLGHLFCFIQTIVAWWRQLTSLANIVNRIHRSEMSTKAQSFSFKKIHLKTSSAKLLYFFLCLIVLTMAFIFGVDDNGLYFTSQWRHNECDGASNHQPHDYLHNRIFRLRSNKRLNLRATGLCEGNSPVTGELPAQKGY